MNFAVNPSPGFRDHPEHRISVEPFDGVVVVSFGDAIIASSDRALLLQESRHQPVYYVPFEDVYFEFLHRTETRTHCPFKGDASYWGVSASGEAMEDVMWAYQAPYDEMMAIKDFAAFYPDKVRIEATPTGGRTRDI
ncbi:DUF427 domain-containing protein [Arvimicrobium flavum]|uniref:DUF427 domain-containing protein n=1 Tax=Arvimicrobium flavum TaxID=3393320 RepID=UPI00237A3936|nr:DUF427 domain-containing protein [Mesorhizobium shangrilense]